MRIESNLAERKLLLNLVGGVHVAVATIAVVPPRPGQPHAGIDAARRGPHFGQGQRGGNVLAQRRDKVGQQDVSRQPLSPVGERDRGR